MECTDCYLKHAFRIFGAFMVRNMNSSRCIAFSAEGVSVCVCVCVCVGVQVLWKHHWMQTLQILILGSVE